MAKKSAKTSLSRRAGVGHELRSAFVDWARKALSDSLLPRLMWFADSGQSFETWLSWELAYGFNTWSAYQWPEYTAQRECPYPGPATTGDVSKRALADIALFQGAGRLPTDSGASCFVELKLIWSNKNAGKQVESAVADARRLHAWTGHPGLVICVFVAAKDTKPGIEILAEPRVTALADEVSKKLGADGIELLENDRSPHPEPWIDPHVLVVAYEIN